MRHDEDPKSESVAVSVREYLRKLALRDGELAESPEAMGALAVAEGLDGDNSLTSKAMALKSLKETMDRLRELAPPVAVDNGVTSIASQRDKRRSREAKASS